MELFWELAVTIIISLLLPLILINLLSVSTDNDTDKKIAKFRCDHGVKSHTQNSETEEVVRIAGKFDGFNGESILGKLIVTDIGDVNCGSRNPGNIDDNEIEVVDLTETPVERDSHGCGLICECAVDESNGRIEINEIEVKLTEQESEAPRVEEAEISRCSMDHSGVDEFNWNREIGENRSLLDDEDDWEGIERTELERRFDAAIVFVGSKCNAKRVANLSDEVKMKLYGYHKIATQGPCREPQPMALKFSARAKWNAWHQLGLMSPELAMERYITIVSESIPDWMEGDHHEAVNRLS